MSDSLRAWSKDDLIAEVRRLRTELERFKLMLIEATNPGIDMEQVKAARGALIEGGDA